MTLSHPYRCLAEPRTILPDVRDPLENALIAARWFLFVWAIARAVVGATYGMDFESYFAIVIAVAAARS